MSLESRYLELPLLHEGVIRTFNTVGSYDAQGTLYLPKEALIRSIDEVDIDEAQLLFNGLQNVTTDAANYGNYTFRIGDEKYVYDKSIGNFQPDDTIPIAAYHLLEILAENAGSVVCQDVIMQEINARRKINGLPEYTNPRILISLTRKLRKLFGNPNPEASPIRTARGLGLAFEPDSIFYDPGTEDLFCSNPVQEKPLTFLGLSGVRILDVKILTLRQERARNLVISPYNKLQERLESSAQSNEEEHVLFDISGRLKIDSGTMRVFKDNSEIEFTRKEYKILHLLLLNKGRVLTREFIQDYIHGDNHGNYGDNRTIDVHIKRIREKLGEDFNPIISRLGEGYQILTPGMDENNVLKLDRELVVDLSAKLVLVSGVDIGLTKKEYDLFADIVTSRGRVISVKELCNNGYINDKNARVVISRLRAKLGPYAGIIHNVRGFGYSLRIKSQK